MATHLSVRVPGEPDNFLINDLGEPFDEITASNLLKLTLDGDAIGRTGCVDPDGVAIHRAAYAARPDIHCAMHIRTLDGAGVALMRQGLRPSNQDALFVLDDVVYHRYGMPGSAEEATALGESCRKGRFIVLNNNGLLSIAATAPAALRQLYTLQRTCEWEIDSRRLGQTPVMIQDRIVKGAARRMEKIRTAADYGVVYFEALKRQLVCKGVSDWSR